MMDYYFALFNCHVNDGANKALADFAEEFGQDEADKLVASWENRERPGIMALVTEMQPTLKTGWFVFRNWMHVNELTEEQFRQEYEGLLEAIG